MIFWAWLFVPLIVGMAIGWLASRTSQDKTCIGTLREDRSDPNEAPYLFLELDRGGMEKLHSNSRVTLRVNIENYIPRK